MLRLRRINVMIERGKGWGPNAPIDVLRPQAIPRPLWVPLAPENTGKGLADNLGGSRRNAVALTPIGRVTVILLFNRIEYNVLASAAEKMS